jgi:hypothetical protein
MQDEAAGAVDGGGQCAAGAVIPPFCPWYWTDVQYAGKASTIFFNFYFRQQGQSRRKQTKRREASERPEKNSEGVGL